MAGNNKAGCIFYSEMVTLQLSLLTQILNLMTLV